MICKAPYFHFYFNVIFFMSLQYFTNSIRCCDSHTGASCAVDSLLEMYFYSIHKFDNILMNLNNGALLEELNAVCAMRETLSEVSCKMRDGVWDWLVTNLPGAYAEKGRNDAEFIAGLKEVVNEGGEEFQSLLHGTCYCPKCKLSFQCEDSIGIVSLHSPKSPSQGSIDDCIIHEYSKRLRHITKHCLKCKGKLQVTDMTLSLPRFLVVELGMVNGMNPQDPPFVIKEEIFVGGMDYELTGAVVMRPEHFFNVVKVGEQYAKIDGYPPIDEIEHYPKIFVSFSGAIQNDELDASLTYTTSPLNSTGVHVVVYHRKDAGKEIAFMPVLNKQHEDTPRVELHLGESVPDSNGQTEYTPPDPRKKKLKQSIPCMGTAPAFCKSSVIKKSFTASVQAKSRKINKGLQGIVGISDTVNLNNCNVKIKVVNDFVFFSCKDMFKALNMSNHIRSEGYRMLDKRLTKLGLCVDEVFIKEGCRRKFIRIDAVYGIVWEKKVKVRHGYRHRPLLKEIYCH